MNKEIFSKENTDHLIEIFSKTRKYFNHAYEGFYQNKLSLLEKAEKEFISLGKDTKALLNQFIKICMQDKEEDKMCKIMISISGHLERIEETIKTLIATDKDMVKSGILFSNKAVKEISHLYEALYDLLGNLADSIKTKNDVLINNTLKNIDSLRKSASQYTTEHEERLISGVCPPKSAYYYLKMLDSLIEIIRHTKKIAQALHPTFHLT